MIPPISAIVKNKPPAKPACFALIILVSVKCVNKIAINGPQVIPKSIKPVTKKIPKSFCIRNTEKAAFKNKIIII